MTYSTVFPSWVSQDTTLFATKQHPSNGWAIQYSAFVSTITRATYLPEKYGEMRSWDFTHNDETRHTGFPTARNYAHIQL